MATKAFALHWVNFTTFWQRKLVSQSKLLYDLTDLNKAILTRLIFEDLITPFIKKYLLRTRNYLFSYLI